MPVIGTRTPRMQIGGNVAANGNSPFLYLRSMERKEKRNARSHGSGLCCERPLLETKPPLITPTPSRVTWKLVANNSILWHLPSL